MLLVEGDADQLAALDVAERLGHDIDAEDLAIVNCGGKSRIPFYARLCQALEVPFVVLFDEDVWPEPADEEEGRKVRESNEQTEKLNRDIAAASGSNGEVFSIGPSLEDALGIGRNAADKPYRVAQELQGRDLDDLPRSLLLAVRALFSAERT